MPVSRGEAYLVRPLRRVKNPLCVYVAARGHVDPSTRPKIRRHAGAAAARIQAHTRSESRRDSRQPHSQSAALTGDVNLAMPLQTKRAMRRVGAGRVRALFLGGVRISLGEIIDSPGEENGSKRHRRLLPRLVATHESLHSACRARRGPLARARPCTHQPG